MLGLITPWAGFLRNLDSPYLACNGTVLRAQDYPELVGILGGTYGGGGGTFTLPNISGRYVLGTEASWGSSYLGQTTGSQLGNSSTVSTASAATTTRFSGSTIVGAHTHSVNAPRFYCYYVIQTTQLEPEPEYPDGTIAIWPGSIASIPEGWRLCDGSLLETRAGSRTLPDLGGRIAMGAWGTSNVLGTETTKADSSGTVTTSSNGSTSTSGAGTGSAVTGAHTHEFTVPGIFMYYIIKVWT